MWVPHGHFKWRSKSLGSHHLSEKLSFPIFAPWRFNLSCSYCSIWTFWDPVLTTPALLALDPVLTTAWLALEPVRATPTLLATPEAKVTVAGFTLLAFFAFLILGWVFLLFWTRANLYSFFFSTCLYLSLFRITRFDCWTNYLPYSTVLSIDDDLFGFDFWIFFPIVRFFLFFIH